MYNLLIYIYNLLIYIYNLLIYMYNLYIYKFLSQLKSLNDPVFAPVYEQPNDK